MDPANGWRSCSRNSTTWSGALAAAHRNTARFTSTWKVIWGTKQDQTIKSYGLWILWSSQFFRLFVFMLPFCRHIHSWMILFEPHICQECDELLSFAGRVRRDVVTWTIGHVSFVAGWDDDYDDFLGLYTGYLWLCISCAYICAYETTGKMKLRKDFCSNSTVWKKMNLKNSVKESVGIGMTKNRFLTHLLCLVESCSVAWHDMILHYIHRITLITHIHTTTHLRNPPHTYIHSYNIHIYIILYLRIHVQSKYPKQHQNVWFHVSPPSTSQKKGSSWRSIAEPSTCLTSRRRSCRSRWEDGILTTFGDH
jgi:hypothetical protein